MEQKADSIKCRVCLAQAANVERLDYFRRVFNVDELCARAKVLLEEWRILYYFGLVDDVANIERALTCWCASAVDLDRSLLSKREDLDGQWCERVAACKNQCPKAPL